MEIPLWDFLWGVLSDRRCIIASYALTSALWTCEVVRRFPPGGRRALIAAPVVLLHLLLPMLFDRLEEPFVVFFLSDASIMSLAKVGSRNVGRDGRRRRALPVADSSACWNHLLYADVPRGKLAVGIELPASGASCDLSLRPLPLSFRA